MAGQSPTSGGALARRQLLQRLAAGGAAGFALPTSLGAGEAHRHVADQLQLEQAADAAAGSGAAATFLDAHQRETLASLAEAIVPGATKADVPAFLDRLLAVDSPARQREFLAALGTIDAEALGRFGRPWLALAAGQRNELLTAVSTAPSSRPARYPEMPVSGPMSAAPNVRDRFEMLKTRIAVAYFTSELGMRELGYTGEMIHEAFAGCSHPEAHR